MQKDKKTIRSFANGIKSFCVFVPRCPYNNNSNVHRVSRRSKFLKFLDNGEDEMEAALMSEVVR